MSWFYLKGVSNFLIRYELSIIGELDKWGSHLLHRWIKALIIKSYQPYYDFHSKISINDTRDLLKETNKTKKDRKKISGRKSVNSDNKYSSISCYY